jgi:LacI family transcriptional regulator
MPGATTRRPAVTIADVAQAAGVSRATVSRVMNGRSTVDPTISARVQEAAIELNYRPSNVARSLSLGRTTTVALVVPDLGNPVFQQILSGVTSAAAEDGYRVLVADSAEDPGAEATLAREARARCDALILVSPRMPDATLDALLPDVAPAVVVNREVASAPSLVVDFADAMVQVVEHLVEHGHRRLAYLAGPPASVSDVARRHGLDLCCKRHPDLEVVELMTGSGIAAGHEAARAVLASRVTGVVAFNDLVAFGLLAALNEAGVAVPADISVCGFDDIELAQYATPALTTVAVPQGDLGRHAWRELNTVIDNTAGAAESTRFGVRLEVRASTGPVPQTTVSPTEPYAADASVTTVDETPEVEHVPTWTLEHGAPVLRRTVDRVALSRYESGESLPTIHSPRPFLHPVHSLAGVPLTEAGPVDHRHHYGVSLAAADVNGTSYWGGRTYVTDVGPTLLPNHGRQTSTSTTIDPLAPNVLLDTVAWTDQHGQPVLDERRRIGARLLDDGWALEWRSTLHAAHGPLEFRSPATNGRPGAGYGGVFWRLPLTRSTVVLSAEGEGEAAAHGSTSPWVAFVQRHRDARGQERTTTTLLAQTSPARPWFLRSEEYPGACPALAWESPLLVPEGGTVETGLVAAILDRELSADEAATLATGLR